MGRPVGVHLHLLAQAAHRHPDIAGIGVLGVCPAPDQEGLRGDGLAEVGGEGVEQARFRGGEGDLLAGHLRHAAMQLEGQVGPQLQALPWNAIAQAPENPLDPRPDSG